MSLTNDTPPANNDPRSAESDTTKITEDEDTIYAKAFEKCLTDLAAEVYGTHDPFDIAQRALRTACEFYEADWCGMFDADMMLDLWMPFWWYNRLTGGMTTTQLEEGRVIGSFEMFRKMIMANVDCYLADIETIRFTKPEEYALFKSQAVKSFLAVPYSRRENGIIFLRNPKRFANRPNMLRIISNILLQEINEQKHLDRLKINAAASDVRKDADFIINLFGGIEIMTEQGKLVEAEMKSLTCSKIFVLLMLNRHRGMSARELSELVLCDKEYGNPIGTLRTHLYRLRKIFELIYDKNLIVTMPNGYRINPNLKIVTDYELFENQYKLVTPLLPEDKQIEILKEVVKIYDGKLFPNGYSDHWHIPCSTKYHTIYINAFEQLMGLLNKTEDYKALHNYSLKAIKVDPNSPAIIYWLVVALRKSGAIEVAQKHLESAKNRLLEEEYQELEYRLKIAV